MSDPRPTIAIIAHPEDGFWDEPRLVHPLISRWTEMGLKVHLVTDPGEARPGIREPSIGSTTASDASAGSPGASPDARLHADTVQALAPGIFDFLA